MTNSLSQALQGIAQAPRRTWERIARSTGSAHRMRWSQGMYKESRFWRQYLATGGGESASDFAERMDPDLLLQDYLEESICAPDGATVRILDVGAGPLTYVGKKSPRWKLEIVAVDPLADDYDRLLANNNITPPVRTIKAEAERLLKRFPPDRFDLVSARNCIDHGWDPFRAVEQMVAVVKPGCTVFMHHHLNEAVRQDFLGMHQWNFADEDGHFILSSRKQRIDVTEALAGRARVENRLFEDTWIVTRITKV